MSKHVADSFTQVLNVFLNIVCWHKLQGVVVDKSQPLECINILTPHAVWRASLVSLAISLCCE